MKIIIFLFLSSINYVSLFLHLKNKATNLCIDRWDLESKMLFANECNPALLTQKWINLNKIKIFGKYAFQFKNLDSGCLDYSQEKNKLYANECNDKSLLEQYWMWNSYDQNLQITMNNNKIKCLENDIKNINRIFVNECNLIRDTYQIWSLVEVQLISSITTTSTASFSTDSKLIYYVKF